MSDWAWEPQANEFSAGKMTPTFTFWVHRPEKHLTFRILETPGLNNSSYRAYLTTGRSHKVTFLITDESECLDAVKNACVFHYNLMKALP